jgi:hypothetical protein
MEVNFEAELKQRILQAAIEMQRIMTAGVTRIQIRERTRWTLSTAFVINLYV